MAYTTPRTWTTGETVTAAIMNTHVRDNISALYDRTYYVPLTTPLTSTSWDGDGYSTTGKTLIDLSSVFTAPAGIKAVSVLIYARDQASSNTSGVYFGLSPNDTDGQWAVVCAPRGLPNDYYAFQSGVCPCDANGDVYYQCMASGSGTLDVFIQIWGYWM
jgi:hypothetical protein